MSNQNIPTNTSAWKGGTEDRFAEYRRQILIRKLELLAKSATTNRVWNLHVLYNSIRACLSWQQATYMYKALYTVHREIIRTNWYAETLTTNYTATCRNKGIHISKHQDRNISVRPATGSECNTKLGETNRNVYKLGYLSHWLACCVDYIIKPAYSN